MAGSLLLALLLCLEASGSPTVKEGVADSVRAPQGLGLLLEEILLKSLKAHKCVMVLTDSVYLPLFQSSWFHRFEGHVSFVLVKAPPSAGEDLLAPWAPTQASLDMAKKHGCQMYILLMANGMQVGRLLKFGDKYRLLSTRANYVLLLDRRLFQPGLLYLWKRFINVVFIRQFRGNWFELSTVPFPRGFNEVLVPRRLDIWTRSQFRKGADLFQDKTGNLQNQTMRVAAIAHVPGTLKGNTAFAGVEIEIMKAVAKQMNFRCALYEPEGAAVELWGRKQVGASYTGLLGEMGASRADVALGDLYYIPFVLEIMDLSVPYNTECLTFLTPEALTDISWRTLILPFSPGMWTCVLLCLALTSATFHWLARFHQGIAGRRRREGPKGLVRLGHAPQDLKYSLLMAQLRRLKQPGEPEGLYQFAEPGNSLLYTYSMLLLVSLPKLPTGWSLRLLTGCYWLYCLLVVVAYRASMTAILSRPTPRVTIDSLAQLLSSPLTYGGWGAINAEFFKASPDAFIQRISARFEIVNSSEEALERVVEGHFAFYENTYFLRQAVWRQQQRAPRRDETRRKLHIMRECIINMPVSLGLQKNSPLKPRLDRLIRRVLEAGLVDKWLTEAMQDVATLHAPDASAKALMDLRKMYGALMVLAIGYVGAAAALMGERLRLRHLVKKRPQTTTTTTTPKAIDLLKDLEAKNRTGYCGRQ